jgi:hypothetical protein
VATAFEPGKYRCVIHGQAIVDGKAKSGGGKSAASFQLVFQPKFRHSAHGAEPCDPYDRNMWLPLTEATIQGDGITPGWVLQTLRYLGWEGTSFAELDPSMAGEKLFDLRNLEIDCSVEHEDYDGKVRERWSIVRSGVMTSAEKSVVKSLDIMFSKMLKMTAPKPVAIPPKTGPTGPDAGAPPFTSQRGPIGQTGSPNYSSQREPAGPSGAPGLACPTATGEQGVQGQPGIPVAKDDEIPFAKDPNEVQIPPELMNRDPEGFLKTPLKAPPPRGPGGYTEDEIPF